MKALLFVCAALACCAIGYETVYPAALGSAFHIAVKENGGSTIDVKILLTGNEKGFRLNSKTNGQREILVDYSGSSCITADFRSGSCVYAEGVKSCATTHFSTTEFFPPYWAYETEPTVVDCPDGTKNCTRFGTDSQYMILDSKGRCVSHNGKSITYYDDVPTAQDFALPDCSGHAFEAPKIYIPPSLGCAFHYKRSYVGLSEIWTYKGLYASHTSAVMMASNEGSSTRIKRLFFTNSTKLPNTYAVFYEERQASCTQENSASIASIKVWPTQFCLLYEHVVDGTDCPDGKTDCKSFVATDGETFFTVDSKNRLVYNGFNPPSTFEYLSSPQPKDFAWSCGEYKAEFTEKLCPDEPTPTPPSGDAASVAKVSALLLAAALAVLLF